MANVSTKSYRRPRTRQPRQSQKPLRIDRLPQEVKDAIIAARASGETWKQISRMASAAAGLHLPPSSLQRWYDLRIEQQPTSLALREIIALLKSILKAVSK